MSVKVGMPNGADERIEPEAVFAIRDATDVERDEAPASLTCIWGSGFRIYPAEPVVNLVEKFGAIPLVRVTSPGGMPMFVNAANVSDCDDRSPVLDHPNTRSVLLFGPGATSPRLRVREARGDLIQLWKKVGQDPRPLEA
jgi:hypothetical protein